MCNGWYLRRRGERGSSLRCLRTRCGIASRRSLVQYRMAADNTGAINVVSEFCSSSAGKLASASFSRMLDMALSSIGGLGVLHLNHATVGRAIQLSKDLWVITRENSLLTYEVAGSRMSGRRLRHRSATMFDCAEASPIVLVLPAGPAVTARSRADEDHRRSLAQLEPSGPRVVPGEYSGRTAALPNLLAAFQPRLAHLATPSFFSTCVRARTSPSPPSDGFVLFFGDAEAASVRRCANRGKERLAKRT
jgi:hypothetical protein